LDGGGNLGPPVIPILIYLCTAATVDAASDPYLIGYKMGFTRQQDNCHANSHRQDKCVAGFLAGRQNYDSGAALDT
jgi:hypothetical protein